MPRKINPVRKIFAQVGSAFDCVAYVVRSNGIPVHTNDDQISFDSAELVIDPTVTSPESIPATLEDQWSIFSPIGTEASPDWRWNPSIDGARGFNLKFSMNINVPGYHQLLVKMTDDSLEESIIQEFWISVRN